MPDVFLLPRKNLTPVFARTQGQEENSLEGQCFKEASLRGSNGALPIDATPGEVPGGNAPPTLRSVSVSCPRDEQDSQSKTSDPDSMCTKRGRDN